jgi:hypothetical protein
LPCDLDIDAAVLAEEYAVTDLDLRCTNLAIVEGLTRSNRDDLTLLWLLLCVVRDDNAGSNLGLYLKTLNNDLIVKWACLHAVSLLSA